MKLSTKGQYAIVALTNIKKKLVAGDITPISLREIHNEEKISLNYLEQLFRHLRIAKIVKSNRGPGGGYSLLKSNVSYKEIMEAVGEKISFSENIPDRSSASNDAKMNFNAIYKTLTEALEKTTI